MVIGNEHINALACCQRDGLVSSNARVGCQEHLHPLIDQPLNSYRVNPMRLTARRDAKDDIGARLSKGLSRNPDSSRVSDLHMTLTSVAVDDISRECVSVAHPHFHPHSTDPSVDLGLPLASSGSLGVPRNVFV